MRALWLCKTYAQSGHFRAIPSCMRVDELTRILEGREPGPLGFSSVPKTAMSNQHLGRKERHVYYNAAQTACLPGT